MLGNAKVAIAECPSCGEAAGGAERRPDPADTSQGFGNPKYESGLQAAPSYSPPAGGSGGSGNVASPRWGASVAGAAGSALSGAGNAISGAGSAISGALSPRHRGHGSESMLVGQVPKTI